MHTTAGQFKSDLIDEVAGLASARLEGDQVDDVQRFVREFYRNVSPGDVLGTPPEDLYAAALSLWNATRTRPAGHPMIRALNPSFEVHGWSSRHSVVEVATDDTPFLVDSVMAELNRRELMVHRLIHPVLPVRRDDAGRRSGLAAAGDPDARLESYQQIVVNRQTNEELEAIVEGLRSVLADVRSAIEDWPAMRERVDDGLRDLSAAPPPISGVDLAEVREFLRWLQEGHFTFLGYREYRLVTSGGQRTGQVVPGSGLGVLRDDAFVIFRGMKGRGTLGSTDGTRRSETRALMILKANCRATVHRSSFMDAVSLLRLDAKGKIAGEHLYLGLFTSSFYLRSPWDVPVVRGKVQNCVERAGLDPVSHDGKALRHILETYPRDELLQATPDELHEAALAILRLQERQRVMLFVRRDPHGRFASCLVYVPRDRYDTAIRQRFQAILERAYGGPVVDFTTQLGGDSQLARVHFVVRTAENDVLEVDVQAVEQQLVDAARAWPDRLRRTLVDHFGEARGLDLFRNYRAAFPTSYREQVPPHGAIRDVEMVEATRASNTFGMNLYRPIESGPREVHFRICSPTGAVPLSDVLPMMEHMGLRVLSEQPARLDLPAADVWLHDFTMVAPVDLEAGFETLRANFHDGFRHLHSGDVEADGFNRLILIAGLTWREVTILRAYSRYLRQVAIPFSGAYMAETLAKNAGLTRLLVELFHARFDPAAEDDREGNERRLVQRIERGLDQVEILDEDRIVRRFLNLTRSTLRTNYYQTDAAGQPKPYLSFKLDCRAVEGLPLPRPMVEIFVYSARMEGVHLRGGRVARGGIRWSDRREDFRTEVLGLMKAQMVKNAVIVPVGSKGGFVVKRPPAEAGRSALMAEVVHCYSTLMRGMLDLTDNLRGEDVVPPPRVLRRDGDDPYLVVAADKGTATFSDIANGIAAEYGFWLGDAFASGGSAGYDHKRMGITARGAWESVTRHFREMGHPVHRDRRGRHVGRRLRQRDAAQPTDQAGGRLQPPACVRGPRAGSRDQLPGA